MNCTSSEHELLDPARLPWHRIQSITFPREGSGVFYVHFKVDDEARLLGHSATTWCNIPTVVIKGSSTTAHEAFAHVVLSSTTTTTDGFPRMWLLQWPTETYAYVHTAIEAAASCDELIKRRVARLITRSHFLIIEHIPDAHTMTTHTPGSPLRPALPNAMFIGRLVVLDAVLNNSDRIPCGNVWSNGPNYGNVLVAPADAEGNVQLYGIDNAVCALTRGDSLKEYISGVASALSDLQELASQVWRTLHRDGVVFDGGESEVTASIADGMAHMLRGLCALCDVTNDLQDVQAALTTMVAVDWQDTWRHCCGTIFPEYLSGVAAAIRSCVRPAVDYHDRGAVAKSWRATLESMNVVIDERNMRPLEATKPKPPAKVAVRKTPGGSPPPPPPPMPKSVSPRALPLSSLPPPPPPPPPAVAVIKKQTFVKQTTPLPPPPPVPTTNGTRPTAPPPPPPPLCTSNTGGVVPPPCQPPRPTATSTSLAVTNHTDLNVDVVHVIICQAPVCNPRSVRAAVDVHVERPLVVVFPENTCSSSDLADLADLSRQLHIVLVCGSMMEFIGDATYITTVVVENGAEIGRYRKRHHSLTHRGEGPGVFTTSFGLRIGVLICMDIEVPDYVKDTLNKKPHIIANPSMIPPTRRSGETLSDVWDSMSGYCTRYEHYAAKYNMWILRADNPQLGGMGTSQIVGPYCTARTSSLVRTKSIAASLPMATCVDRFVGNRVVQQRSQDRDNVGGNRYLVDVVRVPGVSSDRVSFRATLTSRTTLLCELSNGKHTTLNLRDHAWSNLTEIKPSNTQRVSLTSRCSVGTANPTLSPVVAGCVVATDGTLSFETHAPAPDKLMSGLTLSGVGDDVILETDRVQSMLWVVRRSFIAAVEMSCGKTFLFEKWGDHPVWLHASVVAVCPFTTPDGVRQCVVGFDTGAIAVLYLDSHEIAMCGYAPGDGAVWTGMSVISAEASDVFVLGLKGTTTGTCLRWGRDMHSHCVLADTSPVPLPRAAFGCITLSSTDGSPQDRRCHVALTVVKDSCCSLAKGLKGGRGFLGNSLDMLSFRLSDGGLELERVCHMQLPHSMQCFQFDSVAAVDATASGPATLVVTSNNTGEVVIIEFTQNKLQKTFAEIL